jgi:hypothetical protein
MASSALISKESCAQFCRYAAEKVPLTGSEAAAAAAVREIEYRVACDEDVFAGVCGALHTVPGVVVSSSRYTVVHFPGNVRVTLRDDEGAPKVELKTSTLRLRVGTVGLAPLWGVVALERPLASADHAARFIASAQTLMTGGMDRASASLTPPHTACWLRGAWPALRWVTVGKGPRKLFISAPGLVAGQHVALGDVRVRALPPPEQTPGSAAFVPAHVRKCRRQSFQWEPGTRVDCTVMQQGADRLLHHLEVEFVDGRPRPFPPQITELLQRLCRRNLSP